MVHHGLTFFNFIGSALLADRFHHHRWLTWLTCQTLQGQHIKMVNPVWPKDGGFGPIIPRSYCNSCETWIFPKACSKKFGVSNCWLNRFRKQMNSMTKTSEVFQEVTFLSYPAVTFILGGYTSQNKEKCVSACWNRIDVVKKKTSKPKGSTTVELHHANPVFSSVQKAHEKIHRAQSIFQVLLASA